MARLALIEKSKKIPKFATRKRNRCLQCGRPRGFFRDFGMCRICLRKYALSGLIPGIAKASW